MWRWIFPWLYPSAHIDKHIVNNNDAALQLATIIHSHADLKLLNSYDHPLSPRYNPFLDLSDYEGNNETQHQVYRRLHDFFETYYQQHSNATIAIESSEDFCRRKFVRTTKSYKSFDCISGTGNQLSKFYQDFLYAAITNRTFTVPSHNLGAECKIGLSFFTWIPLYEEMAVMYETTCKEEFSGPVLAIEYCGSLDIRHRIVDPASNHYHDAAHYLIFNRVWDYNISDEKMLRINTLFEPTFYDNSRFHAFGFIQMYTINFTKAVLAPAEGIWERTLHIPNSIRISLHIRHFAVKEHIEEKCKPIDDSFMRALKKLRIKFQDKVCLIYAATEREATTTRIVQTAAAINCSVHSINRHNKTLMKSDIITTGEKTMTSTKVHYRPRDHGDYGTGILPFADFLLLQKGDILLGSGISTFSMLIANIIGLHALKKGYNHSPVYWDTNNHPHYFDENHQHLCVESKVKGIKHKRCHCLPKNYD
jgi:hypothetical protein